MNLVFPGRNESRDFPFWIQWVQDILSKVHPVEGFTRMVFCIPNDCVAMVSSALKGQGYVTSVRPALRDGWSRLQVGDPL